MSTHLPPRQNAGTASSPRAPDPVEEATLAPTMTSDSLLRGHKAVAISHNGSVYRLQATRQGKLILTK